MTTEQKVSAIQETVAQDANRRAEEIRRRADEEFAAQVGEAENNIKAVEKERLDRGIASIDADISRELSRHLLESKRELISRRDSLADGVFAEISEKLSAFTGTAEYRSFLRGLMENHRSVLGAGRCLMLVKSADASLAEELLSELGLPVKVVCEPGIALGGFRISFAGRLIDETLDEKLRKKREEFAYSSGFTID